MLSVRGGATLRSRKRGGARSLMRWVDVVEVLVINVFLIALLALVTENYGLRAAYWRSEGFAPTMTRYPLFFVTSAVKGATTVSGLISVDWQQVLVLILVAVDGLFAVSALRGRRQGARGVG